MLRVYLSIDKWISANLIAVVTLTLDLETKIMAIFILQVTLDGSNFDLLKFLISRSEIPVPIFSPI